MSVEQERAFHMERADQCRKMAAEAVDPAIRNLHEQLARFHDAEARLLAPAAAENGEGR